MHKNRIDNKQERNLAAGTDSRKFHQELRVYESHKASWLKSHKDEFVVISGDCVAGFYDTYNHAFAEALERFGIDRDFLIKQIVRQEPVFVIY